MAEIPVIVEHIEAGFGKIQHGWASTKNSGKELHIVECRNDRKPQCIVLCNLGLSNVQVESLLSEHFAKNYL